MTSHVHDWRPVEGHAGGYGCACGAYGHRPRYGGAIRQLVRRPYTPPDQRKERPAPSTAHGAAAALKAATESNRRVWHKAMDANHQGDYELQRAARKARMAAKRRRGW